MTSRALADQRPAPITECPKCGTAYSRTQYALIPYDAAGFRRCQCGLPLVKVATVTLEEVMRTYKLALEETE